MSERVLTALMQLFAIIARPESNQKDRRMVVESFLSQQLNYELLEYYLRVFDNYYTIHQKKSSKKSLQKKHTSASSVKVLKICTAINRELNTKQKIVVIIQLLEFTKIDGEVSEQEKEFVAMVADTFQLDNLEFLELQIFVLNYFGLIPESENLLIIDDNQFEDKSSKANYLFSKSLKGQIRILRIKSVNMFILRSLGENELFINGQLLQQSKVYVISQGSSIRNSQIRPIYFSVILHAFDIDKKDIDFIFEVNSLSYKFRGGKVGLQKMSFKQKSNELVGIMGASGTGKSTLLGVLNGSVPPSEGEVLINGIDIHQEKHKIEGMIGYVSQDDLLIEELTVYQNLFYNAKLCFDDYSEDKINKIVEKTLKSVGLLGIKNMRVGSVLNKKISGGERKRLNIALEFIREPAVLFIDEPTSGLSSRDSEIIMDLLKELALKGKLIFAVIHQPSSDLFKMFDQLFILDSEGYLIYNGDPIDSIQYFKMQVQTGDLHDSQCYVCGNINPEQIFNIVEAQILDEFGNPTHTRKKSPKEWNKHFEKTKKEEVFFKTPKTLPPISFKIPNRFKQFKIFVKRDILSKLSNYNYLTMNLLGAPVLAFVLTGILRFYNIDQSNSKGYSLIENSNLPVYLFVAVIIAIFMGLTMSAQQIIKDRKILKRERFLNLSRSSYLLSKIAILAGISAIQALLFVLIGNSIFEIEGMFFHYWLILFVTWIYSNLLGLNISDGLANDTVVYMIIPFIIIPQIVISGVMVSYDKLNPNISTPDNIPVYGEMVVARWAYEALAVYQFKENKFQERTFEYEMLKNTVNYQKDFWLKALENKLDNIEKNLRKPEKQKNNIEDLKLLQNELSTAYHLKKSKIDLSKLTVDELDAKLIRDLRVYFSSLKNYYKNRFNKYNDKIDDITRSIQEECKDKGGYLAFKEAHFNRSLDNLLRNTDAISEKTEYQNRLYQKINPIYRAPKHPFIKAHFYAPYKRIGNWHIDTFWMNVFVILGMTFILYITLYYRLLAKLLDFFDKDNLNIAEKRKRVEYKLKLKN